MFYTIADVLNSPVGSKFVKITAETGRVQKRKLIVKNNQSGKYLAYSGPKTRAVPITVRNLKAKYRKVEECTK